MLRCTEGDSQQELLGEFFEPSVSYRHCSVGDKSDLIDKLVERNHSSGRDGSSIKIHPTADVSDSGDRGLLEMSTVTFPIKNKTKSQNSVITNFQFDQKLKEETFTLTFNIADLNFLVNSSLTSNEFMFNINGMCHDQPVFSDGIFYMFKGGKMLNCALSQINKNLIS